MHNLCLLLNIIMNYASPSCFPPSSTSLTFSPTRRRWVRLSPERALSSPKTSHSHSPKTLRLDNQPEPVPSFAIVSANVKYPGLRGRSPSREVSLACTVTVS